MSLVPMHLLALHLAKNSLGVFRDFLPFIGDIIYNQSVVLVITVVLIIAGFIVMRYAVRLLG